MARTLGRAFHPATAFRFALLPGAALLTVGRRTVANLLRLLGDLVPGDPSGSRRSSFARPPTDS